MSNTDQDLLPVRCTRCHKKLSEKAANDPANWLTLDDYNWVYRNYADVIPQALIDMPEMLDMTDDEREDYMAEKCYHLGAFAFGPECRKKVAGRYVGDMWEEDKNRRSPDGYNYWSF